MRRPRLLVLDEPGNGLDPRGIRDLRELIIGLNESGVTVLASSHLLAEVEQLCTRVGVLDAGRLVLQDDLAVLRAPTGRILVDTPDADQVAALLDGQVEQRDGQRLLVRYEDAAALNARLVGAGLRVSAIGPHQRTLEEIVLAVTGTGSDHINAPPYRPPSMELTLNGRDSIWNRYISLATRCTRDRSMSGATLSG